MLPASIDAANASRRHVRRHRRRQRARVSVLDHDHDELLSPTHREGHESSPRRHTPSPVSEKPEPEQKGSLPLNEQPESGQAQTPES